MSLVVNVDTISRVGQPEDVRAFGGAGKGGRGDKMSMALSTTSTCSHNRNNDCECSLMDASACSALHDEADDLQWIADSFHDPAGSAECPINEGPFLSATDDHSSWADLNHLASWTSHHGPVSHQPFNYNPHQHLHSQQQQQRSIILREMDFSYEDFSKNMDANLAQIDMETFRSEDINQAILSLQARAVGVGEECASLSGSLIDELPIDSSQRVNEICRKTPLFSPLKEASVPSVSHISMADSLDCSYHGDLVLTCRATNKNNYTLAFEQSQLIHADGVSEDSELVGSSDVLEEEDSATCDSRSCSSHNWSASDNERSAVTTAAATATTIESAGHCEQGLSSTENQHGGLNSGGLAMTLQFNSASPNDVVIPSETAVLSQDKASAGGMIHSELAFTTWSRVSTGGAARERTDEVKSHSLPDLLTKSAVQRLNNTLYTVADCQVVEDRRSGIPLLRMFMDKGNISSGVRATSGGSNIGSNGGSSSSSHISSGQDPMQCSSSMSEGAVCALPTHRTTPATSRSSAVHISGLAVPDPTVVCANPATNQLQCGTSVTLRQSFEATGGDDSIILPMTTLPIFNARTSNSAASSLSQQYTHELSCANTVHQVRARQRLDNTLNNNVVVFESSTALSEEDGSQCFEDSLVGLLSAAAVASAANRRQQHRLYSAAAPVPATVGVSRATSTVGADTVTRALYTQESACNVNSEKAGPTSNELWCDDKSGGCRETLQTRFVSIRGARRVATLTDKLPAAPSQPLKINNLAAGGQRASPSRGKAEQLVGSESSGYSSRQNSTDQINKAAPATSTTILSQATAAACGNGSTAQQFLLCAGNRRTATKTSSGPGQGLSAMSTPQVRTVAIQTGPSSATVAESGGIGSGDEVEKPSAADCHIVTPEQLVNPHSTPIKNSIYVCYPNYSLPDLSFLKDIQPGHAVVLQPTEIGHTTTLSPPSSEPSLTKPETTACYHQRLVAPITSVAVGQCVASPWRRRAQSSGPKCNRPKSYNDYEVALRAGVDRIKDWESLSLLLPADVKLLVKQIRCGVTAGHDTAGDCTGNPSSRPLRDTSEQKMVSGASYEEVYVSGGSRYISDDKRESAPVRRHSLLNLPSLTGLIPTGLDLNAVTAPPHQMPQQGHDSSGTVNTGCCCRGASSTKKAVSFSDNLCKVLTGDMRTPTTCGCRNFALNLTLQQHEQRKPQPSSTTGTTTPKNSKCNVLPRIGSSAAAAIGCYAIMGGGTTIAGSGGLPLRELTPQGLSPSGFLTPLTHSQHEIATNKRHLLEAIYTAVRKVVDAYGFVDTKQQSQSQQEIPPVKQQTTGSFPENPLAQTVVLGLTKATTDSSLPTSEAVINPVAKLRLLGDDSAAGNEAQTSLLPTIERLLEDGLLPHVRGLFGPLPNSKWHVVESMVSTTDGGRQEVRELLDYIHSVNAALDEDGKFRCFALGLLNLGCFDAWLTLLLATASVQHKHYQPTAFIPLLAHYSHFFLQEELVSNLRILNELPFAFNLNMAARLRHHHQGVKPRSVSTSRLHGSKRAATSLGFPRLLPALSVQKCAAASAMHASVILKSENITSLATNATTGVSTEAPRSFELPSKSHDTNGALCAEAVLICQRSSDAETPICVKADSNCVKVVSAATKNCQSDTVSIIRTAIGTGNAAILPPRPGSSDRSHLYPASAFNGRFEIRPTAATRPSKRDSVRRAQTDLPAVLLQGRARPVSYPAAVKKEPEPPKRDTQRLRHLKATGLRIGSGAWLPANQALCVPGSTSSAAAAAISGNMRVNQVDNLRMARCSSQSGFGGLRRSSAQKNFSSPQRGNVNLSPSKKLSPPITPLKASTPRWSNVGPAASTTGTACGSGTEKDPKSVVLVRKSLIPIRGSTSSKPAGTGNYTKAK